MYQENIAWKLLRTNNAPLILAFVADLFSEENEVPYGRARILLDSILEQCRLQGVWITESPATSYLNQWIQAGWLRELDGQLTKTDACEFESLSFRGTPFSHTCFAETTDESGNIS
ncbi:DUF3375 family protein [Serratia silvae]|uniref:DUF3375 family protein n=1 Tax=Serratia silvae TaxID=2824122 RepID=UPI00288ABF4E|nr:DUF3375 family protein [Serratia silvae]